MRCPKCDFSQPDTNLECPRCGVIFAKLDPALYPVPPESSPERVSRGREPVAARTDNRSVRKASHGSQVARTRPIPGAGREDPRSAIIQESPEDTVPDPRRIERDEWLILAGGLAIAAVAFAVPFVRHTFSTLMILVHEMGHAIFAWLFGYPSAPAFDLMYGGGVTIHGSRSIVLVSSIYVLLGALIYVYRRNPWTIALLVTAGVLHAALAFTPAHDVIILFMGHGTELGIACIFLYRALSGSAVVHSAERPLYAAVGFFILFSDLAFAYRLMTSPAKRAAYESAKGGGHWMDFSRIAEDHLNVDLAAVAFFFFFCCLFPLLVAFLTYRYQEHLHLLVTRLWARRSD